MRIVFFGSSDFAVESLKKILQSGHLVEAVVTSPDKQAGRGYKLKATPVKNFALEQALPLLQPNDLKDKGFINELNRILPDLQVVVAFRYLPKQVWQIPPLGTINLHASYLPDYRGAAPINWVLINGEKFTGLTTFYINDKIDTGNIILRKRVPIFDQDTAGSLHDRLMIQGADLLVETLKLIEQGKVKVLSQKDLETEFKTLHKAPKIFRDNSRIDWNKKARDIYNFIRGLDPYPGAWTVLVDRATGQKKDNVKIFSATFEQAEHNYQTGEILTDYKEYLKVATPDGFVNIHQIQMPAKRKLSIKEFLPGFKYKKPFFE